MGLTIEAAGAAATKPGRRGGREESAGEVENAAVATRGGCVCSNVRGLERGGRGLGRPEQEM